MPPATMTEALAERIIAFADNALRNTQPDAPDHWISDREGFRAAKEAIYTLNQDYRAGRASDTINMIIPPLSYWEWMDQDADRRTGGSLATLERALVQATRHARILREMLAENRTNTGAESGENRGDS